METSFFLPIFLWILTCKYVNCEYININIYIFLFLRIWYSVRAQNGLSDIEHRELEAVCSACVKLYSLFLVVNSMKICLQCVGGKHYHSEMAGDTAPVYLLYHKCMEKKIMEKIKDFFSICLDLLLLISLMSSFSEDWIPRCGSNRGGLQM